LKVDFTGRYETINGSSITNTCDYLNGIKHGNYKSWYPSGEPFENRYYMNGNKVGVHTAYWANGNRKFIYVFNVAGEYHGELLEWYESGQLYRKFHYTNGKEDGTQEAWKSDGRIKANYTVINGERYGLVGMKRCFTVDNEESEIVYED
jgi:antitoxin component YwqK of YwqJK toxin-antitoxin module